LSDIKGTGTLREKGEASLLRPIKYTNVGMTRGDRRILIRRGINVWEKTDG